MRLGEVYRITVFVPATHVDALVAGITGVDELSMGDYGEVMWMSPRVTEQFRPGAAARPMEGAAGELSHIDSVRVEFAIPRDAARLDRLLHLFTMPSCRTQRVRAPVFLHLSGRGAVVKCDVSGERMPAESETVISLPRCPL